MVINFLLELIFMGSLGVMIYLMIRALPRISDVELKEVKELRVDWFNSILEKFDQRLKNFLEFFFRRFKILILKLDNFITEKMNSFKKSDSFKDLSVLVEKEESLKEGEVKEKEIAEI